MVKYKDFEIFNIPDIIYKYCDYETGIKIIEDKTLKFSNPNKFNDPFDCYEELIDKSFTEKERWNFIQKRFSNLSRPERRRKNKEFRNDPNRLNNALENALKDLRDHVYLCCFSKIKNNILMWSHYANYHTGFCFGFNFKQFEDNFYFHEVKYKPNIEPIRYFKDNDVSILNWVFTKAEDWKYEKEIRAVYRGKCLELVPFNINQLREVYFGCMMNINKRKDAINKLENNGFVETIKFNMIKSTSKFELKDKRITSN
ncbi:MAG: DUF2971 domain-containing protein [Bacteroidales bacterium]|nr:DUF2971 domain-containing protein [Bacteroidales bacterium]